MTTTNNEPLVKEVLLDASPEAVWAAITDPKKMKEWYFDVSDFKPVVGFEFEFTAGDDKKSYRHLCKVTEVEENKKVTYSWSYDGIEGKSFVTWELFPQGDQTKLVLTHRDLGTFPADKSFARESFNGGWTQILTKNLPAYLAK